MLKRVEILGVSGAGKSTLRNAVVALLASKGVKVLDHRRIRMADFNLIVWVKVVLSVMVSASFVFIIFASNIQGFKRFWAGVRNEIMLRLQLYKDQRGVVILEPGWCMQLAGLKMHTLSVLDFSDVEKILKVAGPPDLIILLSCQPEVCLMRLRGRPRGVPRSLAGKTEEAIISKLLQCESAGRKIVEVAQAKGVRVCLIDVTNKRADEVTEIAFDAISGILEPNFGTRASSVHSGSYPHELK